MVKAYLRYLFDCSFGIVSSNDINIIYDRADNVIISAANEHIITINMNTSEIKAKFRKENKHKHITYIQLFNYKKTKTLAAGYEDGEIVIWDLNDENSVKASLDGHKSAITCLRFNRDGTKLYSAGLDKSIVVWDLISETSLFKLIGHKNAITQIENVIYQHETSHINYDLILSSSKDGLLKLWDLNLTCSIETISSGSNEIWAFEYFQEQNIIAIGCNSDEILFIRLRFQYDEIKKTQIYHEVITRFKRTSYAKINMMRYDPNQNYLYILNFYINFGSSIINFNNFVSAGQKSLEVYKFLQKSELEKKIKRKRLRLKEKEKSSEFNEAEYLSDLSNLISHVHTHIFQKQPHSFSFLPKNKLAFNTLNNNIFIASLQISDKQQTESKKQAPLLLSEMHLFTRLGHLSSVRALALSSNSSLLVSGGGESVKVWNLDNLQCTKNFESGYVTSLIFLPKDRFFVVGEKNGMMRMYDLNKSEQIQEIQGHENSIWSLALHEKPNGWENIVILSGGADKKIKFWELVVGEKKGSILLQESKTLYMTDDIHCLKFSPNGFYYIVSLLDSTIKVFFADSDKLYLSMYGHKLPVLSFDITSDDLLLVSGSADKNIKLWGMDFGNCHKSIFAHSDSIMSVVCVRDTHYFFTGSKDKTIKYWDGDTFQLILEFSECMAEVWSVVVSDIGDFFIAASNDKALRMWKQNKDQVFISEEEEKRTEKVMVENYAQENIDKFNIMDEEEAKKLDQGEEAIAVHKEKFENLKYGDQIMAAIDLAEKMREEYIDYENKLIDYYAHKSKNIPEKPKNDRLGQKTIPEFVLYEISKIRISELDNSLKFLHISYVEKLLYYIRYYVRNNINIDLVSRILNFIILNYEVAIRNSKKLVFILAQIQKDFRKQIVKEKDILGYNQAGLKVLAREIEENGKNVEEEFFKELENL